MKKENRETYVDNNGFLRYEDTCKIVPNQPDNTLALNEMYSIFNNKNRKRKDYSYEELNSLESKCMNDMEL